ncbi:MAG: NAD-dependent succinate-semialdehyde dehydrogenase [Actinobacteria bacterium]|nr:NAD-dependent succinate-semialdehyde dehydrogenase [Actinomycetota bacterium]
MRSPTRYRRRVATVSSDLLRTQAYVGGQWIDADDGRSFPVVNPSTRETIADVPRLGAAETRRAVEAADQALPAWRAWSAKERAAVLRRLASLAAEREGELATLMVLEQGKPMAEARTEVAYALSFYEWFAEEAKRLDGAIVPSPWPDKRILVTREPVGVTAGITPWNFPSAMVTRKSAPALAVGCTMVLKPAEQTPLSALALAALAAEAGVPPGVFSVVTGDATDAPVIGAELTSNPRVRKLGFTGSTEVGKLLMRQCAEQVMKVSLELGGNAPFIVFDDADLEVAVTAAMVCKFRNSGQTCISANRMLVQEGIYDDFLARLTDAVGRLEVGDGFAEGVQVGPLIDEPAVTKVEAHVGDALELGAEVVTGNGRIDGQFYSPSILVDVTPEMRMSREETFGPVAAIARFATEDEAVRIANATPYGLAAYYMTTDLGRTWRVGEALEYGILGVNTGLISTEVAPFGGVKESGIGREGSSYGTDDWTELKYWAVGGLAPAH